MQKLSVILIFLLSSCGPRDQSLPCDPWDCKPIEYDPNPLCRFEKKPTTQEMLEVILSDDPLDLYDDGYEVEIPLRLPLEHEPKVLPPESYISPQCELSDEDAEKLACKGDVTCLQKLSHWKQQQQQVQQQRQRSRYQNQQQEARQVGPACFFFGLICVD